MSDNPFAQPDDGDRTVIRPVPGGARRPPPEPPPLPTTRADLPPARGAAPVPADGAETISFGLNPLIAAAAPLLQLLGRLRNTSSQPDPGELRERAIQQMRAFEQSARDGGVPADQLRPAHYALCASLDDVVLNSPWGSSGGWAARSMVSTFHQGVTGGERFFMLLDQLKVNPGTFLPVLELMYLCLSLGFQGQYRLPPHRPGELDRIREDLYTIIARQRQAADPALSPHWLGLPAPYRPARAIVPTWVMGAVALALIGGLFIWFSTGLNAASDQTFAQMLGAPLAHMPQIVRPAPVRPPPPPPPPALDPLYVFLKPEIDQGLVTVLGTHAVPIVRIRNAGMFASGSATVAASYVRLLERIGEALKVEKGPVTVDGYTDNQPIRTVQFPSNFQLSQARADAARAIIVRALGDPGRVTALGHADSDPLAPNTTPAGREENRRIEVVLRRQS
ncbi:MAG TPA: type IVB secretion system protein IcmH/DotU [Acetobacteraceae bacterium]|jgi:type VI secretion system protein ImpK|nr:type IVB secretion system protein IcmH/DotU [Acetobacteraceae bacterium]